MRRHLMRRTLLLLLGIGSLCSGATTAAAASRDDPEHADPSNSRVSTAAGSAVVVTAHPDASEAALAMLAAGGHAVDALVAAQAVLAVVEPQSSGLGGGGFLLHWNGTRRALEVLDGREVAPRSSRPGDLLQPSGEPLPWRQATGTPRAIGIPGTVALLWEAHQRHGRLPWANTLQPAIRLAREGFRPSPRLRRSARLARLLGVSHSPAFQALYLPDGQPPDPDQLFRNPALARTLETLASGGGPAFYQGPLARQILQEIAALQASDPSFQGWSPADLAGYAVVERRPLCRALLNHQLCTVPPPSSGGLAVLQTLALLERATPANTPADVGDPEDAGTWLQLARAQAWADADRLYWVHDPIDGPIPTGGLLDPAYLQGRAIAMQTPTSQPPGPGLPPGRRTYPFALPEQGHEQGTSQITIADAKGNLASYTSSVETVFGSRHLVAGMVLNNQLTDFAFRPSIDRQPVANRRRPGRRPMSSMAPVIVFRNGQPLLALGTPGGRSIPHLLSRVLLASLVWGEPPGRAVALPHLSQRGRTLVLEQEPPLPWPVALEQLRGSEGASNTRPLGSGTALVQRIDGRWHGAADPRREGTALALP